MDISTLPRFEANNVLLVLLARFSPQERIKLCDDLQSASPPDVGIKEIKIWEPPKDSLVDLAFIGKHGDSEAIIYGAAVSAARLGWQRILVADGLSLRQTGGIPHLGESQDISLVLVCMHFNEKGDAGKDDIRVVAKRVDVLGVQDLQADFRIWLVEPDTLGSAGGRIRLGQYERAALLHDPDQPLFSPDKMSRIGRESLRLPVTYSRPLLPAEVIYNVFSYVDAVADELDKPNLDPSSSLFYTLYQMSEYDLQETENSLRKTLSEHDDRYRTSSKVRVVPWKRSYRATRREFMTLYEALRNAEAHEHICEKFPMFFLDRPFTGGATDCIGFAFQHGTGRIYLRRRPIAEMIKQLYASADRRPSQESPDFSIAGLTTARLWIWENTIQSHYDENIELLRHPEKPYHHVPIPWLPADPAITAAPVFFITKHLSVSEEFEIKRGLETERDIFDFADEDDEKKFCYVPWDREEDGTMEDIWSILVKCALPRTGSDRDAVGQIIVVDKQSAQDGKVIMVDPDPIDEDEEQTYGNPTPLPYWKGIRTGRIRAAAAMSTWVGLDISSKPFKHYFDGVEADIHHFFGDLTGPIG